MLGVGSRPKQFRGLFLELLQVLRYLQDEVFYFRGRQCDFFGLQDGVSPLCVIPESVGHSAD